MPAQDTEYPTDTQHEQSAAGLTDLLLWFLIPGLLQGFGLFYLWEMNELRLGSTSLSNGIQHFLFTAPTVYLLVSIVGQRFSALVFAISFAAVSAWLNASLHARFVLDAQSAAGVDTSWPMLLSVGGTLIIAVVILPFFRAVVQRKVPANHYPSLFEFAWNQLVVVLIAHLFVLLVFAVIWLATILFGSIGVDIGDWIWRPSVTIPVWCVSFALGVGVIRKLDTIVHAMRHLIIALKKVILPLHLIIISMFLGFVLVNGFEGLGENRELSIVLLVTIGLSLALCTAAVGDTLTPITGWSRTTWRLLTIPTLLVSLFACWVVFKRIDNYGPTHLHLAASLFIVVGFLHAVGHVIAAVVSGGSHRILQQTNIAGAALAAVIALLIQTPLFDPVEFSVANQLSRIQADGNPVDVSKLRWMHRYSGRAGQLALNELYGSDVADLPDRSTLSGRAAIAEPELPRVPTDELFAKAYESGSLILNSAEVDVSAVEITSLEEELRNNHKFVSRCIDKESACRIYLTNAFDLGNVTALIVVRDGLASLSIAWMETNNKGHWRRMNRSHGLRSLRLPHSVDAVQIDKFISQLDAGNLPIEPVGINVLTIGDKLFLPAFQNPIRE